MTYDGRVLRVYVDGVLRSTRRVHGALRSRGGPLTIGGSRATGARFKGTIDDVQIWRTALLPAVVRAQMRVGAGRRR